MVEIEAVDMSILTKSKPIVVTCIPAFNEERTIASVIIEAKKYSEVVIVCDDGSSDLTADIAEELGAVVLRHEKNRGKGWALRTIFEASTKFNPDVVVTIDADGQHNPKEIPQLIKPLILGQSDVVLGNRYAAAQMTYKIPRYRQFGLSIIDWLNRRANKSNVQDSQNGFRAYNKKALKVISSFKSNGYSAESEQIILATKVGLRIEEIPVSTRYEGLDRTSKKSPLTHGMSLVGYLLKVMVEERPLALLGIPSAIFLLIGVFLGMWMLQIYSLDHYIVTNIALSAIAFILIGFFGLFTSITLYSITRLSQKINKKISND